MWSLIDSSMHVGTTSLGLMMWLFNCALCYGVARSTRHPVTPFVLMGFLLGLPGLVLTVVAACVSRPPSPRVGRQLRLASAWARDPLLRPQVDEEEVAKALWLEYPELAPAFFKARETGHATDFVGRLSLYVDVRERRPSAVFVYMSVAAFVSIALKLLYLKAAWWVTVVPGWMSVIATPQAAALASLVNAILPAMVFLAIPRVLFGLYRKTHYAAHLYAWWGLLLAGGTDRAEARHLLRVWGFQRDTDAIMALEEAPTNSDAERTAFQEAARLSGATKAMLDGLYARTLVAWCANGLVFAYLFVWTAHLNLNQLH